MKNKHLQNLQPHQPLQSEGQPFFGIFRPVKGRDLCRKWDEFEKKQTIPIASMYPYHPCMVYLPTFSWFFSRKCFWKYSSPMDSEWDMMVSMLEISKLPGCNYFQGRTVSFREGIHIWNRHHNTKMIVTACFSFTCPCNSAMIDSMPWMPTVTSVKLTNANLWEITVP